MGGIRLNQWRGSGDTSPHPLASGGDGDLQEKDTVRPTVHTKQ